MNFSSTILISIVVFLGITLLLVALLLWVRAKLMPGGKAKIIINDDKELEVAKGDSLLSTLAEQKVFLRATAANASVGWWKAAAASCLPNRGSSPGNRSKTIGVWAAR